MKTWKQALLETLAPMSINLNHLFHYTFPSLKLFLVLISEAQILSLLRYSCALGFLLTTHIKLFLKTTPTLTSSVFQHFLDSLPIVFDVVIFLTIRIKY